MTDVLLVILRYGVAMAVGAILGIIFSSGKVKLRGKPVTIPYIPRTSLNFTLVVMLLLAGVGVAIVNQSVQANRQARCNDQFQTAIVQRADLAAEDAPLARRQEELAQSDRDALGTLVRILLGGATDPVLTQNALMDFNKTISENADNREELESKRAQIIAQRNANPIPEPDCVANKSRVS